MRNYRLYLKDIFEAMIAAQTFVEGMDFDAFVADVKPIGDNIWYEYCVIIKACGSRSVYFTFVD